MESKDQLCDLNLRRLNVFHNRASTIVLFFLCFIGLRPSPVYNKVFVRANYDQIGHHEANETAAIRNWHDRAKKVEDVSTGCK